MTPSTRFRLFLVCSTLAGVALLARMSTHVSFHARVLGRYSIPYFLLLLGVATATITTVLLHHPFFYRRVHRFRWPAVVSVGAGVMLLVATEFAVRVFDPLGISHFEESARLWMDYVPDPSLVFRLPAHLQNTYQGVTISTNALGFRDREIEPKTEGELRILLLGDSITFGYGVPIEETYGRKLESILTSQVDRPVRTVNAGMGGFNTVQEYAFLKDHGAAIDPDVVTLMYLPNDVDSANPPFDPRANIYADASKMTRFLLDKSWLLRLAYFASSESETDRVASTKMDAPGVTDSLNALRKMAAHCRKHGARFATFFYREPAESPDATRFSEELFSRLTKVGVEGGFPVIDVRPWWGNSSQRSVTNSVVDWHPNAHAHDILAAGIAKVLLSQSAQWSRHGPSKPSNP
jgi:lysophospholipase L1-like esterase